VNCLLGIFWLALLYVTLKVTQGCAHSQRHSFLQYVLFRFKRIMGKGHRRFCRTQDAAYGHTSLNQISETSGGFLVEVYLFLDGRDSLLRASPRLGLCLLESFA
jgi:hypothetical protein